VLECRGSARYLPILLGVITVAAGLHLAVGDVGSRLAVGPSLLLGGGVALAQVVALIATTVVMLLAEWRLQRSQK
jgi:hypothetical protein